MAIPEKDWGMYEAMQKYGGGFIKTLAVLLEHADPINYARLEAAFPEYFEHYRRRVAPAAHKKP